MKNDTVLHYRMFATRDADCVSVSRGCLVARGGGAAARPLDRTIDLRSPKAPESGTAIPSEILPCPKSTHEFAIGDG